jgi:hypothetical protein
MHAVEAEARNLGAEGLLPDPDTAARKLFEIANGVEAMQDGRIYIEPPMRPAGNATGGTKAPRRLQAHSGPAIIGP